MITRKSFISLCQNILQKSYSLPTVFVYHILCRPGSSLQRHDPICRVNRMITRCYDFLICLFAYTIPQKHRGSYHIISCQQEIKRLRSRHLTSADMITKESLSAKRDRRAAAGFLSVLYHIAQYPHNLLQTFETLSDPQVICPSDYVRLFPTLYTAQCGVFARNAVNSAFSACFGVQNS